MGGLEAFQNLLDEGKGKAEGHLVVLDLAEDAVSGAGDDHLGFSGEDGGDGEIGAVDPPPELAR